MVMKPDDLVEQAWEGKMQDRKKIQYEAPVLIPLNAGVAEGATGNCKDGSTANQCNSGGRASIHSCNPTGALDGNCVSGKQASTATLLQQLFGVK